MLLSFHISMFPRVKDAKTNVGICATDIKKHRSFVFNSMRSQINHNCRLHSAEIAKIARATSAAPTYFEPEFFTIIPKQVTEEKKKTGLEDEMTPWDSRDEKTVYDRKFIAFEDGGTKMNNPSKAAIKLAQMKLKQDNKNPDDYDIRLLSVGTGSISGQQDDPTITYHGGVLHWFAERGIFKSLDRLTHKSWAGGLWGVIQRRVNAHNDHLEVRQHYRENEMEESYRRQQFKVTDEQLDGMDNCSELNMESLVRSAEDMIFKVESEGLEWSDAFRECVGFLKLDIVNKAVIVTEETENEKKNK